MKFSFAFLLLTLCMVMQSIAQPNPELALADQYFADAQYDEALELYDKFYKQAPTEQLALRVVACYERQNKYEDLIKFLDKSIKKQPEIVVLPFIKGLTQEKLGKFPDAEATYASAQRGLQSNGDFVRVGAFLYQASKLDLAQQVYLLGRKKARTEFAFANELANVYAQKAEYTAATQEYLNMYFESPESLNTMTLDLLNMVNDQSKDEIEKVLLQTAERKGNDIGVRQLLYEFYVLTGNFMEAFIQVKALDRTFQEDGDRVMRFAESMRSNKNYDLANKALDYIIEKRVESPYYQRAFLEKAVNGELKAFEQVPVNVAAIGEAVSAYTALIEKFGLQPPYFEAIFRRANLQVFYLNELEQPAKDLAEICTKAISRDDWARALLLLGDIQLIQQQIFEAKQTYTKVSEQFRDRQTGALAKYKLAQLMYYNGEFGLSQAMLGAIKDNTSNDISNDAIKLNLTIMDNAAMDSIPTALKRFAYAQLLIYQRQYAPATRLLDSVANAFPGHPLSDEILWEKANISLRQNDTKTALEYLDRMLQNFPTDILGDDALYTKARIYDFTLKNGELALKYYMEFLTNYPGSLYSVEVRKRVRDLRAKAG